MRDMPSVEALGSGIWSLPVPIPDNPLGYTLTYLVESADGPILVDTGWPSDEGWNALTAGLDQIGVAITDVRGAVLTHFHPDHSGLAERLRAASGGWIAIHQADAAMLRRITDQRRTDRREFEVTQLQRAGAPATEIEAHETASPPFDTHIRADRELSHGELVDLPDRKLRVLWTPGHSPGHICLHLEDSGHLFTGDHILPRITPHVGLYPLDEDHDPLGRFLDSLSQINELGAAEALPAHERRFSDLAGRTSEIIAHHEERLDQLAAALGPEPATLWELSTILEWRRDWTQMRTATRRMAASETAAHLRLLERRGLAVCSTGTDGGTGTAAPAALRWRSTAGSAAVR
ncbi:glyoxylase-like metal-dependent hydrolase (beta-lactamase superfamily II) [Lipingzhangella halophila]|uniref:Glyoxylase-like metal-dependent hydrolase (Beta-lactamase superfamily II) n=1 Tax=Lipingzhangella halophila TaxID=1783352 RepID=A0A7W7W5B4_9ACTN|nr:MBL fold metallo-hydrolase [Lipingzhangella halophila]MBB4933674.1 glyoxylase-like metal-dependent hydrolase (beta-lactamase superfamily II) [Lipingzhangella halophila]